MRLRVVARFHDGAPPRPYAVLLQRRAGQCLLYEFRGGIARLPKPGHNVLSTMERRHAGAQSKVQKCLLRNCPRMLHESFMIFTGQTEGLSEVFL